MTVLFVEEPIASLAVTSGDSFLPPADRFAGPRQTPIRIAAPDPRDPLSRAIAALAAFGLEEEVVEIQRLYRDRLFWREEVAIVEDDLDQLRRSCALMEIKRLRELETG